jgi:hypothetical protein
MKIKKGRHVSMSQIGTGRAREVPSSSAGLFPAAPTASCFPARRR